MSSDIDADTRVTEQAAQWLGTLLDENEHRVEFFAWLAESPRHVEEFLFVLADAQDVASLSPEQHERIEQLSREMGSGGGELGSNVVPISRRGLSSAEVTLRDDAAMFDARRGRTLRWSAGLAAALLVTLGLAWWVATPPAWKTYTTKVGEQREIELRDGSIVHLNTDSSVAVHVTDTSRSVRLLRGEALFSVEHDAQRPFLVHAADAIIQAIGTRFDVYRRPNDTRVSVIEGLVQISKGRSERTATQRSNDLRDRSGAAAPGAMREGARVEFVGAGEAADVTMQGEVSSREAVSEAKAIAWRHRRLVFEEATLSDIAAEFNRYNAAIRIRVVGAVAVNEHFSGTFDADAPEAAMQALASDPTLKIDRVDGEIVIRAREVAEQTSND